MHSHQASMFDLVELAMGFSTTIPLKLCHLMVTAADDVTHMRFWGYLGCWFL